MNFETVLRNAALHELKISTDNHFVHVRVAPELQQRLNCKFEYLLDVISHDGINVVCISDEGRMHKLKC